MTKPPKPEPETAPVWATLREVYPPAFDGLLYPEKPSAADNAGISKLTKAVGVEEAQRLIRETYADPWLAAKHAKAQSLGDAHRLRADLASQAKRNGTRATPATRRGATPVQGAPEGSPLADPNYIRTMGRSLPVKRDANGEIEI